MNDVSAAAAFDRVVARAAKDRVGTTARDHRVVAITRHDAVGSAADLAAILVDIRAVDQVIAVGAFDDPVILGIGRSRNNA